MKTNWWKQIISYFILTLLAIIGLLPILLGALTAFKPKALWVKSPPVWIFTPTFENFRYMLFEEGRIINLKNSLIISISAVSIALIVGIPAAYAFARFRFSGSKALMSWFISLRMIPPVVIAIPFYAFVFQVGLRNTYTGLILAYMSFLIP